MKLKSITVFLICLLLICGGCGNSAKYDDSNLVGMQSSAILDNVSDDEILSTLTNIVCARYTGEYKLYGEKLLLKFEAIEQLFRETDSELFWVHICDVASEMGELPADSNRPSSIPPEFYENRVEYRTSYGSPETFEKDKTYIIAAWRYESVYYPHPIYKQIRNSCLPTDDLRNSLTDLIVDTETKIEILYDYWDSEYLKPHIDADTYKKFPEYVASLVSDNPEWQKSLGRDYIHSDDFEEVYANSSLVVRVKVLEKGAEAEKKNTVDYNCRVVELLKGDLEGRKVKIRFISDTVEKGKEYIVCLDGDYGKNPYSISAKNAVRIVQEEFSVMPIVIISVLGVLIVVIIGLAIIKRRRTAKSS